MDQVTQVVEIRRREERTLVYFVKKFGIKQNKMLRSDASGKTFCPVFVIGVTFYRPDYARAGPWIYLIQKIRTTNSHICLLN